MKKCNLFGIMTLSLMSFVLMVASQASFAQTAAAPAVVAAPSENISSVEPAVVLEADSANSIPVTSSELEEFPYIAVVSADDVYVRSGPATPYYPVCKVSKGQELIVTLVRPGKTEWSRVEPVEGTIAYIAQEFVDIKADAGAASAVAGPKVVTGVVNSKDVRVRAGSADMAPKDAYRVLMLAQEGQEVTILGPVDDFYKIVPPQGCYFWVASEYLKKKSDISNAELDTLKAAEAAAAATGNADPLSVPAMAPEVKSQYDLLRDLLVKYEGVQGLPLIKRDYSELEPEVRALGDKATSPAIKNTVSIMLENITAAKTAQQRIADAINQSKTVSEALKQIDSTVEAALKEISPASDGSDVIVVKGRIEPSAVFNSGVSKRYVLMDDDGLVSCYVVGESLQGLLGKRVSISGPVSYDPFGKTRIVQAVKVVELESAPK